MRASIQFKRSILAKSIGVMLGTVIITPALAQQTDDTEVIQIRGIRGSLQESMSIKRDSKGIVDAISSEDIGKFPDTNLAESLQRITGVSIERNNGEGSTVTVRGFGGDNNLVTLNGRMMPAASASSGNFGTSGGAGRAFDFGNLASESVRSVEVYKTGKANISTGGIGATININTAKPLDNEGLKGGVQLKAVNDTTNRVGDDITPELSGIISFTNDDSTWGVGLTASHQTRHSSSASAGPTGWVTNLWEPSYNTDTDSMNYKQFAISPGPNGETNRAYTDGQITNAPAVGQIYSIPASMRYYLSDIERERSNAQLTLQFAPTENFTGTVDYTYAKNEHNTAENLTSVWRNFNKDFIEFNTDQPVATAVYLREVDFEGDKDMVHMSGTHSQVNELKSLGVNFEYFVSDEFTLNFDYHDSTMESLPNNVGGIGAGSIVAGIAAPIGKNHTFDFRGDFPGFMVEVDDCSRQPRPDGAAPCNGEWDLTDLGTNYSRVFDSAQTTDIKQIKLDGSYELDMGQFDFGMETRAMEMHQQQGNIIYRQGDWSIQGMGELPSDKYSAFDLLGQFSDYDTSNTNVLAFGGDAVDVVKWGNEKYNQPFATRFGADGVYSNDHIVKEDTFAAYAQYSLSAEIGGMPTNILAGVRYESTDVESISVQRIPEYIRWDSDSNFQIQNSADFSNVTEQHSYNYVLPNLDIDLSITDALKARMSFGQTIARARYNDLRASVSVGSGGGVRVVSGEERTASSSNPGLVPLLSNNFDISLEYYFEDASYVSVGYFDKRVSNFIGTEQVIGNHFDLRDASNGPRAQTAINTLNDLGAPITSKNVFSIVAILSNPDDFPNGVDHFDPDADPSILEAKYDVFATAEDPLQDFLTSRPVNNKDANLYGLELAAQHFFGETGFGLSANYTLVRGDVKFDDTAPLDVSQFALPGLSDTANIVAMYEDFGIQARLAYNWRDDYLASAGRNPTYVKAYSQIDFTVSYDLSEQLTLSMQGINITEENSKSYARGEVQVLRVRDLGARYMLAARYTF